MAPHVRSRVRGLPGPRTGRDRRNQAEHRFLRCCAGGEPVRGRLGGALGDGAGAVRTVPDDLADRPVLDPGAREGVEAGAHPHVLVRVLPQLRRPLPGGVYAELRVLVPSHGGVEGHGDLPGEAELLDDLAFGEHAVLAPALGGQEGDEDVVRRGPDPSGAGSGPGSQVCADDPRRVRCQGASRTGSMCRLRASEQRITLVGWRRPASMTASGRSRPSHISRAALPAARSNRRISTS